MRVDKNARSEVIIRTSLIFYKMKVCCVLSLESPHWVDSNEYTQYIIFSINKSAAGIAWCPATALTSSEVTVLNLCTSSSHALYCTKFREIIWNDIKVIEWTWFLYWKFQREIILQKDTISILTIYKITKWHKTEKNCRRSYSSQSKSGHTLFVPSFVKWSQTVSNV